MAKSRHCGGGRIKIRPPMPPVDGQHSPVTFPGFASGFKITGHLGKREAGAASRPLKNHPAAPISKSRQISNMSAISSTRPAHETRKPDMPTTGTSLNDLRHKKITLASFFCPGHPLISAMIVFRERMPKTHHICIFSRSNNKSQPIFVV